MDGFTSGAIARHYFKSKGIPFKEIPFEYYDTFPVDEIEAGSTVYFMDVVQQPYEKMGEYNQKFKLVVIDHHKSFLEHPVAKDLAGLRSTEFSGCMLTWKYFYHDVPMPRLVFYLGKFDIWDREPWSDWVEKCVPANFGALAQNVHPSIRRPGAQVDNFLDKYLDDFFSGNREEVESQIQTVIEDGKKVWTYMYLEYAQGAEKMAVEAALQIPLPDGQKDKYGNTFQNLNVVVMNSRMNSFGFESVFDPEKHHAMVSWYMSRTPGVYEVSMYTPKTEGIDLTLLAKKFGGGGHAGACGFKCSEVIFGKIRQRWPAYALSFREIPKPDEAPPLPVVDSSVEPEEKGSESFKFHDLDYYLSNSLLTSNEGAVFDTLGSIFDGIWKVVLYATGIQGMKNENEKKKAQELEEHLEREIKPKLETILKSADTFYSRFVPAFKSAMQRHHGRTDFHQVVSKKEFLEKLGKRLSENIKKEIRQSIAEHKSVACVHTYAVLVNGTEKYIDWGSGEEFDDHPQEVHQYQKIASSISREAYQKVGNIPGIRISESSKKYEKIPEHDETICLFFYGSEDHHTWECKDEDLTIEFNMKIDAHLHDGSLKDK